MQFTLAVFLSGEWLARGYISLTARLEACELICIFYKRLHISDRSRDYRPLNKKIENGGDCLAIAE